MALLLAAGSGVAQAHGFDAGDLRIEHRPTEVEAAAPRLGGDQQRLHFGGHDDLGDDLARLQLADIKRQRVAFAKNTANKILILLVVIHKIARFIIIIITTIMTANPSSTTIIIICFRNYRI
jgi:hypothetical protein